MGKKNKCTSSKLSVFHATYDEKIMYRLPGNLVIMPLQVITIYISLLNTAAIFSANACVSFSAYDVAGGKNKH
jgi:hypothetical protein